MHLWKLPARAEAVAGNGDLHEATPVAGSRPCGKSWEPRAGLDNRTHPSVRRGPTECQREILLSVPLEVDQRVQDTL